jgi:hypothetical protein
MQKTFESTAAAGKGGPMAGVFLAGAHGHGFASWAQLWILCEFHHIFLRLNFDHFAKLSAFGPMDRQKIEDLFESSGLQAWMRETSADWGTLLFGKFRQQLIGSLEKLGDDDLEPGILPRLAAILHLASQFTVELGWRREARADTLAQETVFPLGNKENQVRELKQLEDSLRQGAARGQGRIAAALTFLLEVWRFGQTQKAMQDFEAQRTRCQSALTALAGHSSIDPSIIRELRKLISTSR